jgi:hypothetical protein
VTGSGLLFAIGGAAVGAFGKWLLEQWSARRKAEGAFAERSTQQVVDLAQDYYWALVNHAGTLADQLTEHVRARALHLMLDWGDDSDDRNEGLRARLNELAVECAKNSFPTLCRLVGLFDEFQFKGSRTYLLKSHFAGEACKRLYNIFSETLPETLETSKIIAKLRASSADNNAKDASSPILDLSPEEIAEKLPESFKAYENWLQTHTPEVVRAAEALSAYSELLGHELALLYKTFFKRGWRPRLARWWPFRLSHRQSVWVARGEDGIEQYRLTARSSAWPRVFRTPSLTVLEGAVLRSAFLRPLPRAGVARTPEAPTPRQERAAASATKGETPKSDMRKPSTATGPLSPAQAAAKSAQLDPHTTPGADLISGSNAAEVNPELRPDRSPPDEEDRTSPMPDNEVDKEP